MGEIYLIVEGDGEREAAPALVRRLLWEHFQNFDLQVAGEGINTGGNDEIVKTGGLEQRLERQRRNQACIGVLVLLDTEAIDICPPALAKSLADRTIKLQLPFPVAIVCACCEYESWFLASLHTIRGKYDIPLDAEFEGDPEQKCNAKEWLTQQMPAGKIYKPTFHQVKMTHQLDLSHLIENVRSFQRLVHAVEELISAIEQQSTTVTPLLSAS